MPPESAYPPTPSYFPKPEDGCAIRAQVTRFVLREVKQLEAKERHAILSRIDPELPEAIEGARTLAWIPMVKHMELCNAVQDVVGGDENVQLWRRTVKRVIQRGFLSGLLATSSRLFGATPYGFLKFFLRAYGYSTRGLGTVSVLNAEKAGVADLVLEGFPSHTHRFSCYVEGLQGALWAAVAAYERPGEVVVLERDERLGGVQYRVAWA